MPDKGNANRVKYKTKHEVFVFISEVKLTLRKAKGNANREKYKTKHEVFPLFQYMFVGVSIFFLTFARKQPIINQYFTKWTIIRRKVINNSREDQALALILTKTFIFPHHQIFGGLANEDILEHKQRLADASGMGAQLLDTSDLSNR